MINNSKYLLQNWKTKELFAEKLYSKNTKCIKLNDNNMIKIYLEIVYIILFSSTTIYRCAIRS